MAGAVREWQQAVAVDPNYSMAYNQLGNVRFLAGDLVGAEHYYTQAVAGEPGNAEAQYNLAMVQDALGYTTQAVQHYRSFLEMARQQPDSAVSLARRRVRELQAGQ